jgi:alkylation response protein AidB-like acyl-CoA dehydrogenase
MYHSGNKENPVFQFPTNHWTDLANELGGEFAGRCRTHDETDAFVADNYAALKARKVFAAGVPEEFGGGGASVADLAGMLRTLAHHCSSTALALSMHTHLGGNGCVAMEEPESSRGRAAESAWSTRISCWSPPAAPTGFWARPRPSRWTAVTA